MHMGTNGYVLFSFQKLLILLTYFLIFLTYLPKRLLYDNNMIIDECYMIESDNKQSIGFFLFFFPKTVCSFPIFPSKCVLEHGSLSHNYVQLLCWYVENERWIVNHEYYCSFEEIYNFFKTFSSYWSCI